LEFSPQHLVDCDTSNSGCNGGWPASAYSFVQKNGILEEKDYPYVSGSTGRTGTCAADPTKAKKVLSGYKSLARSGDVAGFLTLLNNGPGVIALYASHPDFQNYKSGVWTPKAGCSSSNHAVIAAGYNATEQAVIVRNSWDTWWGDRGDIKIATNSSSYVYGCGTFEYIWTAEVATNPSPSPSPDPNPTPTPTPTPVVVGSTVYTDCNYAGTSKVLTVSSRNLATDFPGQQNAISSFKTNNNTVTLFTDTDCRGFNFSSASDVSCLSTYGKWESTILDNHANSVLIQAKVSPPYGCIWLFDDCCYLATKVEICSDISSFKTASFNDKLSAVQFGSGVKSVTLYREEDYLGSAVGTKTSLTCLDQGEFKLFNNAVRSIRIHR